jgi:TonB family protein
MPRTTSASPYILALLCLCILTPKLQAQSTETDIKTRLIDKPLYLRGFWKTNKLRFDSNGQLVGKSDNIAFTLGGFNLKSVHLKPGELILDGNRVGLELIDNQQERVSLKDSIHIEIAASPTGNYGPALDAIFADGLANLTPSLPDYWQKYARENFLSTNTTPPATPVSAIQPSTSDPDEKPLMVGGGVAPPKLLTSPAPQYSQTARHLRYSGTSLINLIVKKDGSTTSFSIVRPIGLGLDEAAIAAIGRYTFQPANLNGRPVAITMNVEVHFQIY